MRSATQICLVLVITFALFSFGQAQEDSNVYDNIDSEYKSTFGQEPGAQQGGASTIEEAKRTGKGYRIGTHGVYSSEGPDQYIVRPGDTLWTITDQFFGDPAYWPQVWSYNPEVTNPHWIFPSDKIRLAPATGPQQAAETSKNASLPGGMGGGKTASGPQTSSSVYLRDMGYLDNEALKDAGQIIGSDGDRMLLGSNDLAYIKFGSDRKAPFGQRYSVFRIMNPKERHPNEQGTLVRVLGTVSIQSYDPNRHVARGFIEEAIDPIERGCKVAVVERQFDLIKSKASKSGLAAKIIAVMRPRELIAFNDLVFIDAGQDKGVQAGNRFFVIRKGDRWRDSLRKTPEEMGSSLDAPPYEVDEYPKESVAELHVVKVRKNTSVAFVTRSDIELKLGDVAETVAGY